MRWFKLLVILLVLQSCRSFKEAECTGVHGFNVKQLNMKGMEAELILGIKNPNEIGFSVYPSEFDVEIAGIKMGKAVLKKRVHIDANTEKDYAFTLKSNFSEMNLMDITKLISTGASGTIRVRGNLKAGKFYLKKKFPVDVKESIR